MLWGGGYYSREAAVAYNAVFWGDYYLKGATKQGKVSLRKYDIPGGT